MRAGNLELLNVPRFTIIQNADLGSRSAHVEDDEVAQLVRLAVKRGRNGTTDRPGLLAD